jgi:hypothetical protein
MNTEKTSLETLEDIKRIMERSSRFISLSGLSGVSAGVSALIGVWIADTWLKKPHNFYSENAVRLDNNFNDLIVKLSFLALAVLAVAVISSLYFTYRKAKKNHLPVWDHTTKKLLINLMIPLFAGGFFVLGLLYHNEWHFVAPACLIFYGLALVNASKYTLSDIRYVGILEILLGAVNMYFVEYSLWFWAVGFGVLHIVYGLIMWWKYDRKIAGNA